MTSTSAPPFRPADGPVSPMPRRRSTRRTSPRRSSASSAGSSSTASTAWSSSARCRSTPCAASCARRSPPHSSAAACATATGRGVGGVGHRVPPRGRLHRRPRCAPARTRRRAPSPHAPRGAHRHALQEFWSSPERFEILGEAEVRDRIESALNGAGSLLERLHDRGPSDLVRRVAQQLWLIVSRLMTCARNARPTPPSPSKPAPTAPTPPPPTTGRNAWPPCTAPGPPPAACAPR